MTAEEALTKILSETVVSADLLENIRNLLEAQLSAVSKTAKSAALPKAQEEGGGALATLGKFTRGLGVALGALLAFVALPPLMVAAVSQFVGALNPGLMGQFNAMLDNLQATIGHGLEPIIANASATLREWSGMLLPVMRELRPVMAELSKTIGDVLIVALRQGVMQFQLLWAILRPVIYVLSMLTRLAAQLMEVVLTVTQVMVDMIAESLGLNDVWSDVKTALDDFRAWLIRAISTLAMFTASVLKSLGANESLSKFRAALEKRIAERRTPAGGLVAAPKDAGTGGPEDIVRTASERAFAAVAGAGAVKTEVDLLEGILKAVEEGERTDWKTLIKGAVKDALTEVKDAAVSALPDLPAVRDVSADGGKALLEFGVRSTLAIGTLGASEVVGAIFGG